MNTMITICYIVGMLLAGAAGFVITYVKTRKGTNNYKALYDAEAAHNAIEAEAERLIQADELDFDGLDGLLQKNTLGTAGSVKFRMVLQALHVFCLDHGFKWDEEAMTKLITDKVAFTKTVNVTPVNK